MSSCPLDERKLLVCKGPIEDQSRGSGRSEGLGVLCEKSAGQRVETKEAAAVLSVLVECPSTKPQANRITPSSSSSSSPSSSSSSFGLNATDGEHISKRETICDIVSLEAKLRTWEESSLRPGVSRLLFPSLVHVESVAVRCGVGDITQNKGVLEQGLSESRLALPLSLKTGQMPL